ncbi:prolipoprotein diacylglyceryl transferase [candidate division GN15 bacterium]|nr:prolipoprotein diacylglyceryl transferase [candidate division GN15 bacterium]
MLPELFHIGSFPIRSWGVMLALSFFAGVFYIQWMTRRHNRQFEPYLTVAYLMIIAGVVGARFSYALLHWSEFSDNLLAIINPFAEGHYGIAGLNLYGGILGAIGAALIYLAVKRMNILDVFDFFAPTLALGIGISRIGCFMNGCCFGTPTDLPWGMSFPAGSLPTFVYGTLPLHPAQLYSAAYGIALFVILHWMLQRRVFVGQLVAVTFVAEAFFRFIIEFVRYYEPAMLFSLWGVEPTYNQVVSVGLFVAGIVIFLLQRRKYAPVTLDAA